MDKTMIQKHYVERAMIQTKNNQIIFPSCEVKCMKQAVGWIFPNLLSSMEICTFSVMMTNVESCHGLGIESSVSHQGGRGLIPGQSM
jgi:hypothetical protein